MSDGSTVNCSAKICVTTVSGLFPQKGALSCAKILPDESIRSEMPSGTLVSAKPGLDNGLSDHHSVGLYTLRSWQVATPIPMHFPTARAAACFFFHSS